MDVVELRTERLSLRAWRLADAERFAAINADPEVMEHFQSVMTRQESDRMLDRLTRSMERDGWGLWAVELRADGRLLGFTGLQRPAFEAHFTPAVEVGWRLARDSWGHGYATEAAQAAIAFAFDELALDELVSFTTEGNVRSRAVMERLGMQRDLADDFDHPALPAGDPLLRHVLYRARRRL
jgi:RimJ/RimL family protein N-acetyltransferase